MKKTILILVAAGGMASGSTFYNPAESGGGGAGLVSDLALLSANSFLYPDPSATGAFTGAANSANIEWVSSGYNVPVLLLSTSAAEPVQFPVLFAVPTGAASLVVSVAFEPASGSTWDGSDIDFIFEIKHVSDGGAWSTKLAVQIGTASPASGSAIQVLEKSTTLAGLSITEGAVSAVSVYVDPASTYAGDVALISAVVGVE